MRRGPCPQPLLPSLCAVLARNIHLSATARRPWALPYYGAAAMGLWEAMAPPGSRATPSSAPTGLEECSGCTADRQREPSHHTLATTGENPRRRAPTRYAASRWARCEW
eukprot:scaffold7401_cov36-Tisochrysis_lutea.AAC.2